MKQELNQLSPETKKTGKRSGVLLKVLLALVLLTVVGYFGFTCEVREGSCAVILRFGAPRAEITEAGLYFKLPWPFETVTTHDGRLQYLESNSLETTTHDNRNIILQSYALWSVSDPLLFHNSVGSQQKVESYINDQIFNATNSVLGSYNLSALVSLISEEIRTEEIQNKIFTMVKTNCEKSYGISVSDVSILRISLPETNLESVFAQMRADRQKDIDSIIAKAQRDADIIISEADTEYSEIIADAQIQAAEIYAKTEAEVAKIYAEAQSANLELYRFLKELDVIVNSVASDSVLVVTSDTYPFNVLLNYGDSLSKEDDQTIVNDLEYILTRLPEKDRTALIDAVQGLIADAQKNAGGAAQ
ncbi:MAG: protease modulator HflC [Clostridia bacterium]|nr:protease modulator HflC [Clostridia bacterium]